MGRGDTDRVYDELLVTLIRAGNAAAAHRLAARWQPRLLRTARRLLNNREQARDAVQETWVGICKGWMSLDDPAKFPAWAFSILHRKCADRIRSAQNQRAHEIHAVVDVSIPSGVESSISVSQALQTLGPDMRIAAVLYFREGLTLAEIATATGVPIGTAKSRIFHARQKLKAILDGESS